MAVQNVGSLVVSLGLDAAEYVRGLDRAEREAKKFADQTKKDAEATGKAIGLAIGAGVGAAAAYFTKLAVDATHAAAALADLSDATGSSVEALSRLGNVAKISGFSDFERAVTKLGAGLAGVDDESSKAARALAFVGVSSKDPAEAIQQLANKLAQYADGASKIKLVKDIFGSADPQLLSFIKDLAEAQNVAATTSTKQAQEAALLEKSLRQLSVESTTLKNIILSDLVPALNTLIGSFTSARKEGLGFWNSLAVVASSSAEDAGRLVTEQTERVAKLRKELEEARKSPPLFNGPSFIASVTQNLATAEQKLKAYIATRDAAIMRNVAGMGYTGDARDFQAQQRPDLGYTGGKPPKPPRAAVGKTVDEFARELERVSKAAAVAGLELDSAFAGTEKLTSAERALATLRADKTWETFTENQKETIKFAYEGVIATEKQTQALVAERQERQKQIEVFQRQQDAQERARESFTQQLGSYADQTKAMERELAIVGQGETAHRKLREALEFEAQVRKAMMADEAASIPILEEQYRKRLQLIDDMAAAQQKLKDQSEFADVFRHSFEDAFASAATGAKSFGEVFKQLERDIVGSLSRIASRKVAESLFGDVGTSGGGFFGAGLNSLFGSLFGSGGGGGSFGGFTGIGTIGAAANGTDYARGGLTIVGERGPELVNLPRGSQVTSNESLRRGDFGGRSVTNLTVNVPQGTSRASADQIAQRTAMQLQRSMARA